MFDSNVAAMIYGVKLEYLTDTWYYGVKNGILHLITNKDVEFEMCINEGLIIYYFDNYDVLLVYSERTDAMDLYFPNEIRGYTMSHNIAGHDLDYKAIDIGDNKIIICTDNAKTYSFVIDFNSLSGNKYRIDKGVITLDNIVLTKDKIVYNYQGLHIFSYKSLEVAHEIRIEAR